MSERVLILRDENLCRELGGLLRADGCTCTFLPVTRTEFIKPQVVSLYRYSWIVFPSANGVRGLYRALESSAHVLPLNIRLAAVGNATAQMIHDHFGRAADIVSEIADGAGLAQTLSKSLPAGTDILYPGPGGHDSDFQVHCRQFGLNVQAMPVYRTLAVEPDALRKVLPSLSAFDTAIFFAPSAVKAFHAAFSAPWSLTAISIGSTTERALLQIGQTIVTKSEHPDAHSIAMAAKGIHSMEWESLDA